ncbi:MAG: LPD1 domain-containing protein [Lachnospiraceae bacterium]
MSNIQDFGEKIGGARKDLYALKRELRLEDIVDWSEYDREKYITKKEVFPLPDYKKLYEEGMNREVLFFIKEVRDALPTKPVVYIPYSCPDEEKEKLIHKAQEDYIMSIGCFYERSMQLKTISDCVDFYDSMRGENLPAIDWTNRKLKKAIRIDSTYRYSAFRSRMEEKEFLYTREEKILSHYTIYQYDGKNVYRESYEKDRERLVIQRGGSKYYVYRTDENPSQWAEESYFALDNHTNQIVASNIANKELLQNTIIDLESNKAVSEKDSRKKKKLVPVQLSHIRPTAEDYRKGFNITGEDMLSVFQFRGGEFGNWESDNDRQTNLNMSYDALKDLAKALEIEDADISLGGQLAIAYGARGISSALAHFEPGTNVINLTKMKGAGALAHEWGHALDYYIASKKGNKVNYATERPTGKLKELLQIMKYNGSNRTQFYEDARHLDDSYTKSGHKGYWQSDVELFARAFASYIRDKLKPSNSDYLVGYSEMKGAYVKNGEIVEASASPQGEERQRINAAMDALIGELKEQGILHHNEYSQDNLIENNQVLESTNEETKDEIFEDATFREYIHKVITGEVKVNDLIKIGATPNVLVLCGAAQDIDFTISKSVIDKCTRPEIRNEEGKLVGKTGHGLTEEQLCNALINTKNPIMVLQGNYENSLVIVSEYTDNKDRPILVSINLDKKSGRASVNDVSSVYGRDKFEQYLQRQISAENILAIDIKKAEPLLRPLGKWYPQRGEVISYDETIAYSFDNVNYKMPPKQILKEGTSMDKLDKIISQYEDFLELFKAHTRNDFKDWQQKRGKQLRETLLNLKEELNANPDSVASLLPNFYEETNPDSLESHGLWNSAWSYIEEHSLAGTHSKEINEIINKPETKALALSIMQDIIDYTDGRLFYCSYIRNGVVINEDIMIHYLHQYGNHVQSMQDSTTSVYMENPETVHYSYQALLDYLKDRDTLRFYINSKEGRTQYLTNDRMTSYLAALDEYLKLEDVQKSIEFSVDGKDFIELAQFSIENSENLDGETILKNIRKNDVDKLGVLHDHMKRLPRVEHMLRNMNDYFTFLLARTNTQMRKEQKADIWKIRLSAPNNSNTYIELSVERTYEETEPGEEAHDQTLVTMHSFVNGIENDTGRIGFPTEKFLSNDPKYNIVEGEIFRGENEKYILRQMCKRLAFAMNENDEPILYMTENLGEALEAFDAKVLQETQSEIDKNMSLKQIEETYGNVEIASLEKTPAEPIKNDADPTFILTGAKVSLQMQDILRRLTSGENVSIEEINDTKEIRYCRSIADNGRETYLQDGRTDKQKQVIAYMESLGCASGRLDREGKMIYDGDVSKGSRLDIVIGLPGAGKSSALVDIISQEFHSKVIDNDIAKEQFVEYQDGLGAKLVHKESQMVCERVLENALAKHENIVLPKVGSDANKLLDNIIASAKERNYEVNVHFVDLERDKTLGRMLGRLITDGRFLDPALIDKYSPDKEHNRCERTYEVLKQNELISGYSRWDNDVEKGEKPFMVEIHNLTGEYINNARLKENEKGVVDNGRIGLQDNGERRQRFSKDLGENGGTAKTSVRGVYEGSDKDNEGGRRELQERATGVGLKPAEHLDKNIIMEKSFAEQVDEVLAGNANQYNALKVCDTPRLLLDVGCEQLPMLFTHKHLHNAIRPISDKNSKGHGLSIQQVKKLPELLENPVMIYDSQSQKNSIVVVTDELDARSFPVIVSIKTNGKGTYELQKVDSNFITSVYGRRNFDGHITDVVNNGDLLYWNKQKSQELFRVSRLQLPGCLNNLDFDKIIHQSNNIVNKKLSDYEEFAQKHKERMDAKEVNRIPIVINAFGGPGSGKSVSCMDICQQLKKLGYNAEYVQEYAKELVYAEDWEQLDGSPEHQFEVLQEQLARVDRLYGKVDFIVTDSPILLNGVYNKELTPEYDQMVTSLYNDFENFTYFVQRDASSYQQEGRIQNLEESQKIDQDIKDLLTEKNIYFGTYNHETIDKVVNNSIATYNRINHIEEPATKKQIAYAKKIAETLQIDMPEQNTRAAYNEFISANQEKFKNTSTPISQNDTSYNLEYYMNLVSENGSKLSEVPQEFYTPELLLAAVNNWGAAIRMVPETLMTEELALAAVKQYGMNLRSIPNELKNEDVCIEAYVSSGGKALRYVPADLKDVVKEHGNKTLLSSSDIPDEKRQIDVSDIQESGREWVSNIDNILKEHESNPEAMVEDIAFAAKFYKYSVKNIQLMLQQNQGITYVASSNAFSTMGYHVKDGEQPLVARVPVFSKYVLNEHGEKIYMNEYTEQIRQEIKNGNLKEHRFVRKFQFVAAFYDISQTDCPVEDYPSLYHMGIPSEFHQEAFEAMKQFAEDTLGFKVIVEDLKSISLYGSCDVKNKVIRINNRLESTQALSTLCHEIAHGILHSVDVHNKMTSAQKECEADVMSIMLETSLGLSISPARREHLYNHFHEYKDEQANKEHPYEVALEKLIDRVQSKVFKVYIDDINHYLDLHLPKNKDKTVNQKLIRDMANLDVAYDKHTSEFIIPDLTSSSQNQMNEYTESYRKISDEIRLNNSFVPKLGVIRKETTDSYETYELMDVQLLDDKIAKLLIRFPEQIRREYLSLDIPRGSILALKQNVMENPIYYQVTENELIPLESSYAEQISNDLPESKINAGLTMQKEFESLQELYQAGVRLTEEQQQRYKHLNRYLGQQKSNYSSQEFMTRLNLMTQDLSVNNRELINEYVFRTGNFERAYKYCEQLEKEPGVVKKMLEELHAVDTLKYMLWTISEYEDATGVSSDKRITTGAYNNASLPVLTENVTSIQNITDAYKLIQKYEVMERFKNYAIVKQNDKFLLADVILDDYIPEIRLSDMKFDSESDAKLYYENELSGDKRNLLMGVEDLEVLLQKDSKDNAVYLDTFVSDEQIDLYRELSQSKEPMVDAQDNVIYDDLVEANKKDDIKFANSIDMYLNNTLDKTSPIIVGKTSNALALAGAELNKIVTINYSTIKKCMSSKETVYHGHELDSDIVKQIPEQLRNPVMILKGSHDASLIVVSNLVDKNNDKIIISINLDKKMAFCEVNQITSMYGKEKFTNYISKQLDQGNLIACNNKKADEMLHSIGLQLPQENTFINYDDSIIYNLSYVNASLFKNRGIVNEAAASLEQSEPSQEAFKSISESHVCQDKYAYVDFGNPEKTYLYTTDLIGNIWRNPITDESAYDLYSRLKKADYQVCMSFADFKALAHNQSIERFNNPMRQKEVYIRIIESNQEQLPKDSYMSVYDFKKNMDVLQMDTNAEKLDVTYKVITRHNREICSYINKIDNNDTEDVYLSIYNKVKEQDPDLCKKIAKQYYKDQIQFNEEHLLRPLMEFVNTQENDDQLLETAELLLDSNDALNKEIRKLDIAPADAEILKLQAGKIDSNKLMNIENQIQMNSQIKQKNQQTKKDISIAD